MPLLASEMGITEDEQFLRASKPVRMWNYLDGPWLKHLK